MTALRPTGWSASPAESTPGHLLNLIRSRDNWTRQQLLLATGLSRTTLFARLNQLFAAGFAYEAGAAASTGGRPAYLVRFEDRDRVVLVLDLGHRHGRIAVTDLAGASLREEHLDIDISTPPQQLLAEVYPVADELLRRRADEKLVGVGIALPGPVSPVTGRLTPTTVMPDWHHYPLVEEAAARWRAPVLLENDARAYALGEAAERPGVSPLVAVKYANGIGAGIVLDGQLLCGAGGSAGDIGHIRISSANGRRCRCGRAGCLAAYASGHALIRQLRRPSLTRIDDIVDKIADHSATRQAVRDAAALLGRSLSSLVATLNPRLVVLGGVLGRQPIVVEEIAGQINKGAIDRVTSLLEITASTAHHPVAAGMAALVVGEVYSPQAVNSIVEL